MKRQKMQEDGDSEPPRESLETLTCMYACVEMRPCMYAVCVRWSNPHECVFVCVYVRVYQIRKPRVPLEPLELAGSRGSGACEDSGAAERAGGSGGLSPLQPLIIVKLESLEHLKPLWRLWQPMKP